MSTLSPKDRVSLCMFSFADGRRCRTPRIRNHPHFCYYHAEKEARARAAQSLGTDLARYFSGNYLSACDLSTALGCLIPAVIRGDVKPKVARTVAYMAQTLLQSIHISRHEYCKAYGTDAWRSSIANSVHGNHIYRFPPAPVAHPLRGEACRSTATTSPAPPQPQQPARPPHTPLPRTGAEFAQQVLAALQTGQGHPPQPGSSHQPACAPPSKPPQPAAQPIPAPQTPTFHTAPSTTACHPESSEGSQPIPTIQHSPVAHPLRGEACRSTATTSPACPEQIRRDNPPPTRTSTPQCAPNRDPYAVHFESLRVDGKLL